MWRTAVLKCFVHRSKFGLDVVFGQADFFEDFDEDFGVVITDGSGEDLVAVQYHVVLVGLDGS